MSIASIVALVVAFGLFGGVVAWLAREAARDRLKHRLPPKLRRDGSQVSGASIIQAGRTEIETRDLNAPHELPVLRHFQVAKLLLIGPYPNRPLHPDFHVP